MEAIYTLAIFQVDVKMLQSSLKYLELVQKMYGGVCAESVLLNQGSMVEEIPQI